MTIGAMLIVRSKGARYYTRGKTKANGSFLFKIAFNYQFTKL